MSRLRRTILIVLVAAFAAGTVAHAAGVAAMTVDAAMADAGGVGGAGCSDCAEPDGGAPACDQVCLSPALGLPVSWDYKAAAHRASSDAAPPHTAIGRTAPPDPYPPRDVILT